MDNNPTQVPPKSCIMGKSVSSETGFIPGETSYHDHPIFISRRPLFQMPLYGVLYTIFDAAFNRLRERIKRSLYLKMLSV